MAAKRGDWKATPLPDAHASLSLNRTYNSTEFDRICKGRVPQQMEDKWFIFYEEPWLYLHRSWSGVCIYQVRFEISNTSGHEVIQVLANRDPEQYKSTNDSADALLLAVLLDADAGRDTKTLWEKYLATQH